MNNYYLNALGIQIWHNRNEKGIYVYKLFKAGCLVGDLLLDCDTYSMANQVDLLSSLLTSVDFEIHGNPELIHLTSSLENRMLVIAWDEFASEFAHTLTSISQKIIINNPEEFSKSPAQKRELWYKLRGFT